MPLRLAPHRTRHLAITTHRSGPIHTVAAQGHIDLATYAPWHDALIDAATSTDPTTHLVADLTDVTHLSWASTAALIRAHHACNARGRHLVVRAGGAILTGLRLTRLDHTLTITPATTTTRTATTQNHSEWLIA
ncbi:STAS domain-containing protein [Actinokineospora sp. NPDC004072]